jgi:co-chaperonin GroES (HSP10)
MTDIRNLFKEMTQQVEARHEWVLVQAEHHSVTTKGGIEVPHDAVASVRWGEVLSVGEAVKGLLPGDKVCWPEFTGLIYQANADTWFLRDSELVASGKPVFETSVGDADAEPADPEVRD